MRRGVLALVVVALLVACGGDGAPATTQPAGAQAPEITIKTFSFKPNPLDVKAGTTVKWTNQDQILHTVTFGKRGSPTGEFSQDLNGVGATASFTFSKPGTYHFHCMIHGGMDAQVLVS